MTIAVKQQKLFWSIIAIDYNNEYENFLLTCLIYEISAEDFKYY